VGDAVLKLMLLMHDPESDVPDPAPASPPGAPPPRPRSALRSAPAPRGRAVDPVWLMV